MEKIKDEEIRLNTGIIKLFDIGEADFSSNGLKVITPISLMESKEKSLNGWSIEAEVSIDYNQYIHEGIIAYVETKSKGGQPFVITNTTKTNNTISFTAEHYVFQARNYLLNDVRPTKRGAAAALLNVNNATDTPSPFTTTSDVSNTNTAYFIRKTLFEALLTIESRWGGSYDIDKFNINLRNSVGVDKGYSIRYGSNLEGIEVFEDWSQVLTKIMPVGPEGLTLPEKYLESDIDYGKPYSKIVEFDSQLEEEEEDEEGEKIPIPREELVQELRTKAAEYMEINQYPKVSYEVVSNVNQEMDIGDIIEVIHPVASIKTEVIAYQYNILTKRTTEITFGNYKRSVKGRIDAIKEDIKKAVETSSSFEQSLDIQTGLINSMNKFGNVYVDDNQIMILDRTPKDKAKNVWRWNAGGLGYSENGVEGPFKQAWTMDGTFSTEFITANSIMTNQLHSDVGSTLDISSNEGIRLVVDDYNDKFAQFQLDVDGVRSTVSSVDNKITDVDVGGRNYLLESDTVKSNYTISDMIKSKTNLVLTVYTKRDKEDSVDLFENLQIITTGGR